MAALLIPYLHLLIELNHLVTLLFGRQGRERQTLLGFDHLVLAFDLFTGGELLHVILPGLGQHLSTLVILGESLLHLLSLLHFVVLRLLLSLISEYVLDVVRVVTDNRLSYHQLFVIGNLALLQHILHEIEHLRLFGKGFTS